MSIFIHDGASARAVNRARLTAAVGCALAFIASVASAQILPIAPAQQQALGLRFEPVGTPGAALQATARVVPPPNAQVIVAAPYGGVVTRVMAALGQTVHTGQPLAAFSSPQWFEAQRALQEARAQQGVAQDALKRDRALYDEGIIAQSRWRATQGRATEAAAAAQARGAEVASAGIAMIKGEPMLVATQDGVISGVEASAGLRVDAATPLFRITRGQALELDIALGADRAVPVVGDVVQVPQRGASGKVAGVAPGMSGTAVTRVRVALERIGTLRAGESVLAEIKLASSPARPVGGKAAVTVPAAALLQWQGRTGVFVATAGGARFVPVQVLNTNPESALVSGEFEPGARVAVAGLAALKGMLMGQQ